MDSNAEYTPEGVVTELVPANLTPDAIILGQQPEVDIVWSANVIVDRGPGNDLDLVSSTGSCTVSGSEFGYDEMQLEDSAMAWLANGIDEHPDSLTVVSFRWSLLTY